MKYTYKPFADIASLTTVDLTTEAEYDDGKMPFPYIGVKFAKKSIKDDKIISLLAVDKDVAFEESLAKKILDSNAIISIRQCMLVNRKTGKCRDVIRYSYPLYYPEHPMFKESICRNPTPLAANAEATLTFEVVFAFDDELVFPMYPKYTFQGPCSMIIGDITEQLNDIIEMYPKKFLDDFGSEYLIRKGTMRKDGFVRALYCSARDGNISEIELDEHMLKNIRSYVASIRVVGFDEKVHKVIAIDGPCAAGKTTQAKLLAKELGYMYVDTGAMYRTIAVYMQKHDKCIDDIDEVLNCIDMYIENKAGEQRMFLGNEDVTSLLRTPEISKLASDVSAIPAVREFLLQKQRNFAQTNDIVMEGRDIGTVIFPDANIKFFLTADTSTRAHRRYLQLHESGAQLDENQVLADIKQRDFNDSNRKDAPLKQASDAILVDCSNMSIEKTTHMMLEYIEQHK